MPTYTCTAACADCGTLSSPLERTRLPSPIIRSAILQAQRLGFPNVVFTGGEPTLRWRDLLDAIDLAHGLGLATRLVTNAHWARSPVRAAERVAALQAAGLDEINYSTGDEHVRFVPLDRVVFAAVAAIQAGLPVFVSVEARRERAVTADSLLNHPAVQALGAEADALRISESPWMPLDPNVTGRYREQDVATNLNLAERRGCEHVLRTYTLQADGRIGACCGLGLRTIPELNSASASVSVSQSDDFLARAVEDAEADFLKLWIHYLGPERILAWASEKNPLIKWEGMYAHPCQACNRLYKDEEVREVIREHHAEMVAVVLQTAWLDDRYTERLLSQAE